jgi:hypothetical protein
VSRGLGVRETRVRDESSNRGRQRQLSKGIITSPTIAWSSD